METGVRFVCLPYDPAYFSRSDYKTFFSISAKVSPLSVAQIDADSRFQTSLPTGDPKVWNNFGTSIVPDFTRSPLSKQNGCAREDFSPGPSPPIQPATNAVVSTCGLIISTSDSIRSFLTKTSSDSSMPEDLRGLSSSLLMQPTIPYRSLKSIWLESARDIRPNFSTFVLGSSFIFTSPKSREKSRELMVRLKKLEEAAHRKAYQELVKDITPRKSVEEPFSSYKDQLGFGMHVVLTMFTGYLFGYAAFRALFSNNAVMSAAGGILGLVIAMLLETVLFMIRFSSSDRKSRSSTSPSSLKTKKSQ